MAPISLLALAVLVLGLLQPPMAYAGDAPDYIQLRQQLSAKIQSIIEERNIVGLSVALVDKGSIVWSEGFGYADGARRIETTANTQFRVGSITKLFTALATLQLEEEHWIDIDQPVSAYLERFQMKSRFSNDQPITVRNVLTHHSGLPTDLLKGQWSSTDFNGVVEQLRNEYVSYPPEFVLSYSNVAYSLLGSLIEETTQQPYESYIQEHIAMPLNMANTGFHPSNFDYNMSFGFDQQQQPQDMMPIRDLPALGLYSSANDLARFITLFTDRDQGLHHRVLPNAAFDEMLHHQNRDVPLDFDDKIGIAWMLDRCGIHDAGTIAEHGGTTMFFASQLMIARQYDLGVVILSNTQGSRKTIDQLAEMVLQAAIDLKRDRNTLILVDANQPNVLNQPVAVGNGGDYLTPMGLVSLDTQQDKLCACSKQTVLDLVPQPSGWYNLKINPRAAKDNDQAPRVTEITIGDQQVMVMHYEGRTQRFGSRMPEHGISDEWKARLGNYRVLNPDPEFPVDHVSLLEKEHRLYLGYRLPMLSPNDIHTPLAPITDNEAVTVGLGRTRGETVQIDSFDESDREYLVFSGFIAEKVSN